MTIKGYQPQTKELDATTGNNTLRVQLVRLTHLVLTVVQAGDRSAIAGASVRVQPAVVRSESTHILSGQTDAKGTATSSKLSPQDYTISVEKEGYEPAKTTVSLSPGDNAKTISLTKKAVPVAPVYYLKLEILGGDKEVPIGGAGIKVERSDRVIKEGSSTDKGSYTCELPGTGKYTLLVTRTGFHSSSTSLNVSEPETTRKIVLKPAAPSKRTINVLVPRATARARCRSRAPRSRSTTTREKW